MKPTTLTSTLILLSLIGCSAKNNAPVDSIDLQQEIEESTDELADAGEGGRLVEKAAAKAEEGEPSLLTEPQWTGSNGHDHTTDTGCC